MTDTQASGCSRTRDQSGKQFEQTSSPPQPKPQQQSLSFQFLSSVTSSQQTTELTELQHLMQQQLEDLKQYLQIIEKKDKEEIDTNLLLNILERIEDEYEEIKKREQEREKEYEELIERIYEREQKIEEMLVVNQLNN